MSFIQPDPELNPFAPTRQRVTPENFTIPAPIPTGNPYFGNPIPSAIPGIGRSTTPTVISRLPESLTAFENKYAEFGDIFRQQMSPATYQALVDFDWRRAERGQTPLSAAQTQRVISAVENKVPFTPPPDKSPWNLLGNTLSDIGTIAKSLPALPAILAQEVIQIPNFTEAYQEQLDQGANSISALARSPGIRLLPGSYTVGNVASGTAGVHEALTHPLMSVLDLLPAGRAVGAGKAISRIPVPGPVENLGQLSATTGSMVGRSRVGQGIKSVFGNQERQSIRPINQAGRLATEWLNANSKLDSPDALVDISRRASTWQLRNGLDDSEVKMLWPYAVEPDVNAYSKLAPKYQAALDDLRDINLLTAKHLASAGEGALLNTQRLTPEGTFEEIPGQPEFFVSEQASPILLRRAKTTIQSYGNAIRELINPTPLTDIEPHVITKGPRVGQEATRTIQTPVERTLDEIVGFWPTVKSFTTTTVPGLESVADSAQFIQKTLTPARLDALTAYTYALESKGIDVSDLLTDRGGLSPKITGAGKGKKAVSKEVQTDRLLAALEQKVSGPFDDLRAMANDRLNPYRDPETVLQTVKPYTYSPPFSKKFIVVENAVRRWKETPLDEGNFQVAINALTDLRRTASNPLENSVVDAILQSLRSHRNMAGFVNKLNNKYTPARLRSAQRAQDKLERKTAPARFYDILSREAEGKAQTALREAFVERYSADPRWDVIEDLINNKAYEVLNKIDPETGAIVQKAFDGVEQTWRDLKASGVDPQYVHHTSPSQAEALNFPRPRDFVPKPTSLKLRTLDATPYVDDIQISLNAQHLEILHRKGMEWAVDEIIKLPWVRTTEDLAEEYLPAARRLAQRKPIKGDIELDTRQWLKQLMSRDYAEWNPHSLIRWRAPQLSIQQIGGEPTYLIPKSVKANFERLDKVRAPISTATDPITSAFRTSVLPLSPRWHAYNILGGYLMLSMETNPLVPFQYIKSARELIKTGKTTVKGRTIDLAEEFRLMQGGERDVFRTAQLASGRSMSRWFFESLDNRNHTGTTAALRKAGELGRTVIEKSFDLNQFFDDTYRAMAYIYGLDKSLTKGLSYDDAMRNGMSTVRKVMHSLDSLTPMERSIMRSIFPFYGFMSHIMRFALRFPYDHPFRTAVIASFARNELEDQGTGLPEKLLGLIPIGGPDSMGTQRFVNLTGANPFADVANLFTLQGWVGNVNPLLSTALQQIGIDPATASPELYPDVTYDAESGRLQYRASNPILSLLSNTIPQTRFLQAMVGGSREYEELARENPDAARRLLLSNAGIPLMWRDINLPQERIKVQLAIERGEQEARTQALKSGDWSDALRYPSLRPLYSQVQELQSTQEGLMPYNPQRLEQAQNDLVEYFA